MGLLDVFSWTVEDIQANSNSVKELVVADLVKKNIISEQAAEEYLQNNVVVVCKKGVLGELFDKALGLESAQKLKMAIFKR